MQGENLVLTNKELKKLTRLRYFDLSNGRLAGNFKDVLPNIRWLGLCNCNSVPVGLNLEKLVILRLKDCSVSDGWKGWQELKVARKLKVVSLRGCSNLKKVPDFSNCGGLDFLDFSKCLNMQGELDIRNFKNLRFLGISETKIIKLKGEIGSLQNLQELDASHSSLIEVPTGISKLSSLEYLDLTLTHPNKTNFTEMLPKSLKILAISSSSLSALPSSLTYLKSCYCEHLPNLANLTNLSKLVLMDTEIGEILGLGELKLLEFLNIERAPNLVNLDGLDNLVLLKKLSVEGCPVLDKLPSLAALTRLEMLQIEDCPRLSRINGVGELWESLSVLDVRWCSNLAVEEPLHSVVNLATLVLMGVELTNMLPLSLSVMTKLRKLVVWHMSLIRFPDLSNLKNLRQLKINFCQELIEVTGFDTLELLELIDMEGCQSIVKLPDLSCLVKLKTLDLTGCTQLTEIRGVGRLDSLEILCMSGCESIKELPNLSGLENLRKLHLKKCRQLREVSGLEGLELMVFEADQRLKVKYVLNTVARYGKQLLRSGTN